MPLIQGDAKDKLQSVIGFVFQHQGAFRVFAMHLAWQARRMLMAVSSVKKRCISCSSLDSSVAKDLKFASKRGSDVASTRELQAATTMLAR